MLAPAVEHVAKVFAESGELFCGNVEVGQEELLPDPVGRYLDQLFFRICLVRLCTFIDVLQQLVGGVRCADAVLLQIPPEALLVVPVTFRRGVLGVYRAADVEENRFNHNSSPFSFILFSFILFRSVLLLFYENFYANVFVPCPYPTTISPCCQ